MKIKRLNDKSAEKEITSYIIKEKRRGTSEVSILDISNGAKLPLEQIDRIMEKFEKEGRIKEVQ